MINKISEYIEPIIILIVVITLIELILPNNKNKKYVMFVCSLIIMISIVNPILKIFDSDINISEVIKNIQMEMKEKEYSLLTKYNLEHNIYESYIANLKDNMTVRLEDIGYKVIDSKINVNKDTYEPETIEMTVKYDDGYVQPIIIDVFENIKESEMNESDINKVKDMLVSNYGVEKNKIKINQK